jgi:hypothetical protein
MVGIVIPVTLDAVMLYWVPYAPAVKEVPLATLEYNGRNPLLSTRPPFTLSNDEALNVKFEFPKSPVPPVEIVTIL